MPKNDLKEYLAEMQHQACHLHELLCALTHLNNDGGCPNGAEVIAEIAEGMAAKLNRGLDSVNLPAGELEA